MFTNSILPKIKKDISNIWNFSRIFQRDYFIYDKKNVTSRFLFSPQTYTKANPSASLHLDGVGHRIARLRSWTVGRYSALKCVARRLAAE